MTAIFKRELKAYFATPIGFIILAAYYFFLGLYFSIIYEAGSPDVHNIIIVMSTVVVFTVPFVTMRLMSEDRRQKVDQALLTAPVSIYSIVGGKYLAALSLVALGFAPTIIFEIITAANVSVNLLSFVYSLFGMLLLASALIAIGMFISSLTESSVVSAILTIVINILILYMSSFATMVKAEWLAAIMEKAAFISAVESFGSEILSIPDILYFVSITLAFLFLSVRSIEKRRWS